ncbi:MAG: hypothetical protein SF070_18955, partial [Gemmatimonadota bacterium]|nr:hypothetical protein [Gemmatimonadota bacterium]
MSCHSLLAAAGLSLLATVPLTAQQRDTVQLVEIVVTADRAPTPAPRVVAATTVLSGEQLRAQGIYFVDQALA